MKEIATVSFLDADSKDEALAIVRASDGLVAMAFSLRCDGDLEVCLGVEDCRKLIDALQRAVTVAEGAE